MPLKFLAASLALLLASLALADDVERLPEWHSQAHPLIKPTAKEVRWKSIPWLTNLDDAVKAAKEEKRPLLVWTTGDDPMERC